MMVLGLYMIFEPIVNLFGYIPLVGGLISGIVGFAFLLAAILISILLYIITISIAWVYYHPKVGLVLLGIGAIVLAVILIISHNSGESPSFSSESHFSGLRQMPY
jgi:hypothetical protein